MFKIKKKKQLYFILSVLFLNILSYLIRHLQKYKICKHKNLCLKLEKLLKKNLFQSFFNLLT